MTVLTQVSGPSDDDRNYRFDLNGSTVSVSALALKIRDAVLKHRELRDQQLNRIHNTKVDLDQTRAHFLDTHRQTVSITQDLRIKLERLERSMRMLEGVARPLGQPLHGITHSRSPHWSADPVRLGAAALAGAGAALLLRAFSPPPTRR